MRTADWSGSGSCPSGKIGYLARADAERATTDMRDGQKLRPYPCADCERWHIGHKPKAVIRGEVTADEWYSARGRNREPKNERRDSGEDSLRHGQS